MRLKKECDECGRKLNKLTIFKGEFLCYTCFLKKTTMIGRWLRYHKFNEAISDQIAVCVTASQKKIIKNRAEVLNTTMSDYIRDLIAKDLKNEK